MIRLPVWHLKDQCEVCEVAFGWFNARSHCRLCGRSVCRRCLGRPIRLPFVKEAQSCCQQCPPRVAEGMNFSGELMSSSSLREWFSALHDYTCQLLDPMNNDLNRLVRRGVPKRFRATVWPVLLKAVDADVEALLAGAAHVDDELLNLDLIRCDMSDELKEDTRLLCLAIAPAAKYEQGFECRLQEFPLMFFFCSFGRNVFCCVGHARKRGSFDCSWLLLFCPNQL